MDEQEDPNEESIRGETTTAVDDGEPQQEEESQELHRRGDVEKCPVCGSHVDSRPIIVRLVETISAFTVALDSVPPDTQLQCVNQQCDYYGKLVCDVCDVEHERDEEPSVYPEPEDGYWPGLLLLALLSFGPLWYFYSLRARSSQ